VPPVKSGKVACVVRDAEIQREETIMSTTGTTGENRTDKTVRRLDDFPELLHALRDGDLQTGRLFCAQLFHCDGPRNLLGEVTRSPQVATTAH
jgi:hypothetical protein